jgi:hypothetical protein
MKLVLCVSCLFVLLADRGEGCYQAIGPSVMLRSRNVAGTVVAKGRPWVGAHVSLREPPGAYAVGAKTKFTRKIGSTITDNGGGFSFANIEPGRYTILIEAEMMDVQVANPEKGQDDKILARLYTDSCLQVLAISADGKIVQEVTPTILGAAGPRI